LPDLPQDTVADQAAGDRVDLLEPVDIDEQEGHRLLQPSVPADRPVEARGERPWRERAGGSVVGHRLPGLGLEPRVALPGGGRPAAEVAAGCTCRSRTSTTALSRARRSPPTERIVVAIAAQARGRTVHTPGLK